MVKPSCVHVFVALCDNQNQGIVKVNEELGNGQNPKSNLYWGAKYGVRTFFEKSPHWKTHSVSQQPDSRRPFVLERAVFTWRERPEVFVVAEAYDGAKMPQALVDFFATAAGKPVTTYSVPGGVKYAEGSGPDLVCFVGHNGLMDERLAKVPRREDGRGPSQAVVLACKSRSFFTEPLRSAGCLPLVLTNGLMAPEAYTLDAVLRSWAKGADTTAVVDTAAGAYAQYQKISKTAALKLFAERP